MAGDLKLGWHIGYWARSMPQCVPETLELIEGLGFDSVWTAESWGSDVLSPLAWWGSRTTKLRLGTNIMQMSARQPTATAMAAITMDHLSGGRFCLGLGVSGPQVVEGWYGHPFTKPLARTREYVDIVRKVLAREEKVTERRPAVPDARCRRARSGQAAQRHDPSPPRRPTDLPRGRGTEERGPRSRDRRRLVPDLLRTQARGAVPRSASPRASPGRRPAARPRSSRSSPR